MQTFEELAASRREWISDVLEPWCRQATRKELLKAAAEWNDIAGRVDPQPTLWTWAWSRFEALTHPELSGLNETALVRVELNDGVTAIGYPDGRLSENGQLFLIGDDRDDTGGFPEFGPFSMDNITRVQSVPAAV